MNVSGMSPGSMSAARRSYNCAEVQVRLHRKLDVHEAVQKLHRMMEWRRDFLGGKTPSEADVAPEASTGKAYLHSQRDVNGRPVIIIRARRHVTGKLPSCSWTLHRHRSCVIE